MHTCPMVTGVVPHVGGPVLPPGGVTVLIGGTPAARLGDMCTCVGPPDSIIKGEPTVLIGNMPAARMGDMTAHGGVITLGCPTVLIGMAGGGGGAGVGPFATADEAARAALTVANPMSIHDNLEYGGVIYRGPDGQYYYTGPVAGTDQGFNPSSAPAPPGTDQVGDFHTHGDYSVADPTTGAAIRTSDPARDSFNSDNFSGRVGGSSGDIPGIMSDAAGRPGYAGYLGTPSGTFRRCDGATGAVTNL
jgi:uncharacterized Zn-binding protein involved in type VI secretion